MPNFTDGIFTIPNDVFIQGTLEADNITINNVNTNDITLSNDDGQKTQMRLINDSNPFALADWSIRAEGALADIPQSLSIFNNNTLTTALNINNDGKIQINTTSAEFAASTYNFWVQGKQATVDSNPIIFCGTSYRNGLYNQYDGTYGLIRGFDNETNLGSTDYKDVVINDTLSVNGTLGNVGIGNGSVGSFVSTIPATEKLHLTLDHNNINGGLRIDSNSQSYFLKALTTNGSVGNVRLSNNVNYDGPSFNNQPKFVQKDLNGWDISLSNDANNDTFTINRYFSNGSGTGIPASTTTPFYINGLNETFMPNLGLQDTGATVTWDNNTGQVGYRWDRHGTFINTTSQALNATVGNLVTINTTAGPTVGMSINSGGIRVETAGVYKLGVSMLIKSSTKNATLRFFWKSHLTGTIANSGSLVYISGNNTEFLAYAEIFVRAVQFERFELYAYPGDTGMSLHYDAATGDYPASPPVIITVYKISN